MNEPAPASHPNSGNNTARITWPASTMYRTNLRIWLKVMTARCYGNWFRRWRLSVWSCFIDPVGRCNLLATQFQEFYSLSWTQNILNLPKSQGIGFINYISRYLSMFRVIRRLQPHKENLRIFLSKRSGPGKEFSLDGSSCWPGPVMPSYYQCARLKFARH